MTNRTHLKMSVVPAVLIAALLSVSCAEGPASGSESAAAKTDEHASAGAKPGSHEDWCGEHQVPESMCTRCNAALIPAFKATGDWCAEHGLPESQCLKCNPNLKIVRPPPGK